MHKLVRHRILELLIGIPLLLFGGSLISGGLQGFIWVQQDAAHRRGMSLGTPIGILPFLIGSWLVGAALFRIVRQNRRM